MSIQTQHTDTIAAIATATGGGVGIVRVSGKNLLPLAQEICHKHNISPRKAEFCSFFDEQNEASVAWATLLPTRFNSNFQAA